MQTVLEIFYVRIVERQVHYQRKQRNLTQRGGDPNRVIRALVREKCKDEAGRAAESEFIVHSTSWRYKPPRQIVLTYVAYSDELEFKRGQVRRLPIKRIRALTQSQPRSRTGLENQVVAHALRHIAFLVKTGDQGDFKTALTPATRQVFQSLWVTLAGRVR